MHSVTLYLCFCKCPTYGNSSIHVFHIATRDSVVVLRDVLERGDDRQEMGVIGNEGSASFSCS